MKGAKDMTKGIIVITPILTNLLILFCRDGSFKIYYLIIQKKKARAE